MAAIYLEHEFFGDERFADAAHSLNEHRFLTEMRVIRCWRECYNNGKPNLTAREIRVNTRWPGEPTPLIAAFVEAGICDPLADGTYEFHGVAARLAIIEENRAARRAGGLSSAKKRAAERKSAAAQSPRAEAQLSSTAAGLQLKSSSTAVQLQLDSSSTAAEVQLNCSSTAVQRSCNAVQLPVVPVEPVETGVNPPKTPPSPVDNFSAPPRPDRANLTADYESQPRARGNREASQRQRDESVFAVESICALALRAPKDLAEIHERVPAAAVAVVERRIGPGGWPTYLAVLAAQINSRTGASGELAQLRNAIQAELRKSATEVTQ